MNEPRQPRTYSGKLAALIVVAVVVVFVLLNVVSGRFVPKPAKPVPPATVTERPTVSVRPAP